MEQQQQQQLKVLRIILPDGRQLVCARALTEMHTASLELGVVHAAGWAPHSTVLYAAGPLAQAMSLQGAVGGQGWWEELAQLPGVVSPLPDGTALAATLVATLVATQQAGGGGAPAAAAAGPGQGAAPPAPPPAALEAPPAAGSSSSKDVRNKDKYGTARGTITALVHLLAPVAPPLAADTPGECAAAWQTCALARTRCPT